MKKFLELSISNIQPRLEEPLTELCKKLGSSGSYFEILSNGQSKTKFKSYFSVKIDKKRVVNRVAESLEVLDAKISQKYIKMSSFCAKSAKKSQKMIKIGNFLIIDNSQPKKYPKSLLLLKIRDIMAFGTGYHETTQLSLKLLGLYVKHNFKILDIGTGTGILAIAAARLGAKNVLAVDNDLQACKIAKENIKNNNVESRIKVVAKDIFKYKINKKFDLIIANLTVDIHKRLLKILRKLLKRKGIIILSGIHEKYKNNILKELKNWRFQQKKVMKKGEWLSISVTH